MRYVDAVAILIVIAIFCLLGACGDKHTTITDSYNNSNTVNTTTTNTDNSNDNSGNVTNRNTYNNVTTH